jgi:hypothetical protein
MPALSIQPATGGLVEGFVEFGAAFISESYGDPSPFLYPSGYGVDNIQEDLKARALVGAKPKQIFGIFQGAKARGSTINNLHDLYSVVYQNPLTNQTEVNVTFIDHGIYNNSLGDFIQGRRDPIGQMGDPVRHMRFDPRGIMMSRQEQSVNSSNVWGCIVLPDINGSYLKTSGAAGYDLLNISYIFAEPFRLTTFHTQ